MPSPSQNAGSSGLREANTSSREMMIANATISFTYRPTCA